MAVRGTEAVMEGFLCPICKADLGSPERLTAHFQDSHSEDQDLLKHFKDLFVKAKKKIPILKQEEGNETSFPGGRRLFSPQESFQWGPQEFGASTSHMKFFEAARSARREMYTVNENRLIIRLDKLLHDIPTDPVKKKAHEQKMVPWVDGKDVPRCPDCSCPFHTAPKFTRQHHCRLCGSVMCQNCSHFLPLSTARRMLDKPEKESDLSDQTLRICSHCLKVLETREQIREMRSFKPIICQFYDRLMEYRIQTDENAAVYTKMVNSLCSGETEYNLSDAQALRMNIKKQADTIDALSQKILILGTKDTEMPPSGQALRLQKCIRIATIQYLSKLATLPNLPTDAELKHAQFKRRQEMAAKIQEEKMQDARLRSPVLRPETTFSPQHQKAPSESNVSVGQGWVPVPEKKRTYNLDDPLIEQINIIKNYIQEAKAAHKYDEVASLEANLQELNEEYWRQQQEQDRLREELLTNGSDSTHDSIDKESSHSNDTQSEQLLSSSSSSASKH